MWGGGHTHTRIHVFRTRQAQDTYRRVLRLDYKFYCYCCSFKQGANSLYGQAKGYFPSFYCTPLTLRRKISWGYLITECLERYLGLRGTRWHNNEGDCIMRSFIICSRHQILLDIFNQKNEMGRLRSNYGAEKRCIWGFCKVTCGKKATWKA